MTELGLIVVLLQMLAILLLLFGYLYEIEAIRKLEGENRKHRNRADHVQRQLMREQVRRVNEWLGYSKEIEELHRNQSSMTTKYERELEKLRYEKGQFLKWSKAKRNAFTEESSDLDSGKGVDSN